MEVKSFPFSSRLITPYDLWMTLNESLFSCFWQIDSQSSEIERLFEENSTLSNSYHEAVGIGAHWENQVFIVVNSTWLFQPLWSLWELQKYFPQPPPIFIAIIGSLFFEMNATSCLDLETRIGWNFVCCMHAKCCWIREICHMLLVFQNTSYLCRFC